MGYLVIRLIYAFAFSVNFLLIVENLTIYKIKKGKLVYILITVIGFVIITHNRKEFLLMPIATLAIFYVIYNNSKNSLYALLISILSDLVFAISEVIVTVLIHTIFYRYINNITEDSFQYVLILLPIVLLSFIISWLLKKVLNRIIEKNNGIVKKLTINSSVIIYAAFALVTIYFNTNIYRYIIGKINAQFLIFNGFTILGNFLVVIILIYNNNKNIENRLQQEYKDRELEQLQEYVDTVENLSDGLRKFKHDYMNIFNAMGTYIESNDMDGLRKFYNEELIPESEKIMVNDVTPYLLKNMKINSLKGVISSKIVNAHFNDIRTHIEIIDEIAEVNISDIDICRIIGIFLDNAIESAVLCDDKSIHLAVIKNNQDTTFIIKNTCLLDVPPIHKLKENGFSTKGNNRGLGLSTVDDIINKKYTNVSLRTKVEESIFTQELVITN